MMPEIDGTPCASPRTTSAMPAANGPFTRSETRSHGDATFSHASIVVRSGATEAWWSCGRALMTRILSAVGAGREWLLGCVEGE